jgi:hypothetical protein
MPDALEGRDDRRWPRGSFSANLLVVNDWVVVAPVYALMLLALRVLYGVGVH